MDAVTSSTEEEPHIDEPDQSDAAEEEPWPPPEWRQASRSLGRKEAAAVFGSIFGIIGVLVLVSIWAAHVG